LYIALASAPHEHLAVDAQSKESLPRLSKSVARHARAPGRKDFLWQLCVTVIKEAPTSRSTFQDQFGKYRRHHRRVTRFVAARLAGRDRDAVDDLVQDTFCDALAEAARFDDDVFGCLLRLAARAVTRHLWAARRHARAVYTVYEDHPAAVGGAPAAVAPADRLEVGQALAELAPDQRRAIELLYLDGQSRSQVAVTMGRSVSAVRTLQRRGLGHLRRQIVGGGLARPDGSAEAVAAGPGRDAGVAQRDTALPQDAAAPAGWR
jgi:RNA polymerase sigma-70 factor, ECF subfamily